VPNTNARAWIRREKNTHTQRVEECTHWTNDKNGTGPKRASHAYSYKIKRKSMWPRMVVGELDL
jgi:hypothetical protein